MENEGRSLTVKGKKGEFNMEEQEKPQCHFCMGLLIGGAIGALAGILFAAKSGKELRSDIKGKVSEVGKDAEDIYADSSTKAKAIFEEVKHQAKELKKDADRHLSEARQKANEILASTGEGSDWSTWSTWSTCASTSKIVDARSGRGGAPFSRKCSLPVIQGWPSPWCSMACSSIILLLL